MNYFRLFVAGAPFFAIGVLQSMNRYRGSDIFNSIKRYVVPLTIDQIKVMSFEEKNIELSGQAFVAFKRWDSYNIKPERESLDNIIKFVRCGASADCHIYVRNESIERMFTPLYLALVSNSIAHAKELLENGAQSDIVWSISTVAKTDQPFYFSALQVADRWCDDSGDMKRLICLDKAKKIERGTRLM